MVIQQNQGELVIRLPQNIPFVYLQEFLNYLKTCTLLAKSQADDEGVEQLSEEILSDWWAQNQHRFVRLR